MSDVSPPPVEWKYDYVQTAKPADAEEGESWYDLDDDRALVFTDNSGGTRELTVTEHAQLAGITRDAHHNPVSVEGPLRLSSGQVLDLAAADGLTLDADGQLRVASNAVTPSMLNFDPVTQSELGDLLTMDGYQDVSGSRSLGTWHTNDTGTVVKVAGSVRLGTASSGDYQLAIELNRNKVLQTESGLLKETYSYASFDFLVPAGAEYRVVVDSDSGKSLDNWYEATLSA